MKLSALKLSMDDRFKAPIVTLGGGMEGIMSHPVLTALTFAGWSRGRRAALRSQKEFQRN